MTALFTILMVVGAHLAPRTDPDTLLPPREAACHDLVEIGVTGPAGKASTTITFCPDRETQTVWVYPPDALQFRGNVRLLPEVASTCRQLRALEGCPLSLGPPMSSAEEGDGRGTSDAFSPMCESIIKRKFRKIAYELTDIDLAEDESNVSWAPKNPALEVWRDDVDFFWKNYLQDIDALRNSELNLRSTGEVGVRAAASAAAFVETLLAATHQVVNTLAKKDRSAARLAVLVGYRHAAAAAAEYRRFVTGLSSWAERTPFPALDLGVAWLPDEVPQGFAGHAGMSYPRYNLVRRAVLSDATESWRPQETMGLPVISFSSDTGGQHLWAHVVLPVARICDAAFANQGNLAFSTELLAGYFARVRNAAEKGAVAAMIDGPRLLQALSDPGRPPGEFGERWRRFFDQDPWPLDVALQFESTVCPNGSCWTQSLEKMAVSDRIAHKDFFQLLYQTIATQGLAYEVTCESGLAATPGDCSVSNWQARRLCMLATKNVPLMFKSLGRCKRARTNTVPPQVDKRKDGKTPVDFGTLAPGAYEERRVKVDFFFKVVER